jgi:hypothetical protein
MTVSTFNTMQIISEKTIGRDVEWAVTVSFEILPWNFPRTTAENKQNPWDKWSPDRD